MGYYTTFELGVDDTGADPISLAQFNKDIEEEYEFGSYDLQVKWLVNRDCDNMKWYDWKEDVEKLSLRYPNLILWLRGDGEEAGDVWKAWFRNGKSVVVKPKLDFPTPANLSEKLPLIPVADLERTRLKAQISELEVKLANL